VAARLADAAGFRAIDTDDEIVNRVRMPIGEFFTRFGEPAFRAIEADALAEACRRDSVVIATGGGVVLSPTNWASMRPESAIIGLAASPESSVARMTAQAERDGVHAERPLLAGDALMRLRGLLEARQSLYAAADVTIDTEGRSEAQVSEAVSTAIRALASSGQIPFTCIDTPAGRSDIFVSAGVRQQVGELISRRWPTARRVWIISDEHVSAAWGLSTAQSLDDVGIKVETLVVAAGEASKRMAEVERLCVAMTNGGVTRRDVVVALGGGVVGDLAGFVASVVLRGLPLVQLPTSLLAMVDSSVGGKTGVNTPSGKNLIGAFYQPSIVMIDPDFLATLPPEEFRSGTAEVVKHALIQSSTPFSGDSLLKRVASGPLNPSSAADLERVLSLNVAIKRSVVQADERESGLRMILNFGHTAGHAIEADGYRYRHGEAIAIGMVVATRTALALGRVDSTYLETVENLLSRAGLPIRMSGTADDVMWRLSSDKKNVDGALNWILPRSDGVVERVTGVPIDAVRDALIAVGAT